MKIDADFQLKVEVLSKIVTTLFLVLGGIWTVTSYFAQRKADLENRQLETRKPFLQKRLESCIEVTNAAAIIAANTDSKDVVEAKKKFWTYYWGSMRMVDDVDIRAAMDKFASCLSPDKCPDPKSAAVNLAVYCRKSLGGSWDQVPLAPAPPTNLNVVARPSRKPLATNQQPDADSCKQYLVATAPEAAAQQLESLAGKWNDDDNDIVNRHSILIPEQNRVTERANFRGEIRTQRNALAQKYMQQLKPLMASADCARQELLKQLPSSNQNSEDKWQEEVFKKALAGEHVEPLDIKAAGLYLRELLRRAAVLGPPNTPLVR